MKRAIKGLKYSQGDNVVDVVFNRTVKTRRERIEAVDDAEDEDADTVIIRKIKEVHL